VPTDDIKAYTNFTLNLYDDCNNQLMYFSSPFNELVQYGQMIDFSHNNIDDYTVSSKEVDVGVMMQLHPLLTLRSTD